MRGLQPLCQLQGMPEGRPDADSGGTGSAAAGAPAAHRMKPAPISTQPLPYGRDSNPSRDRKGAFLVVALILLSFAPILAAQAIPYSRPVETAPQQDTIGGGYKTPAVQKPLPRDAVFQVLDVLILAAAMGISVWLVLQRRSRKWAVALT